MRFWASAASASASAAARAFSVVGSLLAEEEEGTRLWLRIQWVEGATTKGRKEISGEVTNRFPPKGRERLESQRERSSCCAFSTSSRPRPGLFFDARSGGGGNAKVQGDEKALLFAKEEEER